MLPPTHSPAPCHAMQRRRYCTILCGVEPGLAGVCRSARLISIARSSASVDFWPWMLLAQPPPKERKTVGARSQSSSRGCPRPPSCLTRSLPSNVHERSCLRCSSSRCLLECSYRSSPGSTSPQRASSHCVVVATLPSPRLPARLPACLPPSPASSQPYTKAALRT